jgi:hypothetical protein
MGRERQIRSTGRDDGRFLRAALSWREALKPGPRTCTGEARDVAEVALETGFAL